LDEAEIEIDGDAAAVDAGDDEETFLGVDFKFNKADFELDDDINEDEDDTGIMFPKGNRAADGAAIFRDSDGAPGESGVTATASEAMVPVERADDKDRLERIGCEADLDKDGVVFEFRFKLSWGCLEADDDGGRFDMDKCAGVDFELGSDECSDGIERCGELFCGSNGVDVVAAAGESADTPDDDEDGKGKHAVDADLSSDLVRNGVEGMFTECKACSGPEDRDNERF
jgi:hypothetical protein